MNARPVLIVTTAGVADWAAESEHHTAWLAHSLSRHLTGDWGNLDVDDRRANDHAVRNRDGRLLSKRTRTCGPHWGCSPNSSIELVVGRSPTSVADRAMSPTISGRSEPTRSGSTSLLRWWRSLGGSTPRSGSRSAR